MSSSATRGVVVVIAVVALVGCGPARLPGAPAPGAACTNEAPQCSSTASISICESSQWVDYVCPGTCSGPQKCDYAQVQIGASCPKSFDGVGQVACNAAGTAGIGCRGGVWAEVACPVCRDRGGSFSCS